MRTAFHPWNDNKKFGCNRLLASVPALVALLIFVPRGLAAPRDFQRDIKPLFAEHCLKCHGAEKQKGGFRLDVKSAALKGGDSEERGIVPGNATKSRLFQLVSSKDKNERMPPEGDPLTAAQIDLLKRWIDAGAV